MALTRGIPAEMLAALESGMVHPVTLIDVEWSDGDHYYFHTGFGELDWNGVKWLPASYLVDGEIAQIGRIELPEESLSIASADAGLAIASSLSALLATQAEYARGLEVAFYFGVTTTPGGNVLVGDAVKTFTGVTSGNSLTHNSPELNMQITSGVPARAAAAMVHSTEDQQLRVAGDTLFDRLGVAKKWNDKGVRWPE